MGKYSHLKLDELQRLADSAKSELDREELKKELVARYKDELLRKAGAADQRGEPSTVDPVVTRTRGQALPDFETSRESNAAQQQVRVPTRRPARNVSVEPPPLVVRERSNRIGSFFDSALEGCFGGCFGMGCLVMVAFIVFAVLLRGC
jgi:hypothetical protein